LTRRIQALRKKAKLQKQNKIELAIITSEPSLFDNFEQEIQEKTGASKISISNKFDKLYTFKDKLSVRNKQFEIGLNKK
ncbi:unnamed protein product, partial [marine sediment metagenome]